MVTRPSISVGVAAAIGAAAGALVASSNLLKKESEYSTDSSTPSNSPTIPATLRNSQYADQTGLAVKLAWKAGQNMLPYCQNRGTAAALEESLSISTKSGGDADFCTQVDLDNEDMISCAIRDAYPSHEILGEESASASDQLPSLSRNVPTWIVDPVDGTTNFASGLPLTCVSIALYDPASGGPVVGVIYAPVTDELYVAVRGCGAYRNGIRIEPRPDQQARTLKDAVVCCELGYPRDSPSIDAMLGSVRRILSEGKCRAVRQLGSGCLDLCYVATGRLDVVYAGVATEGWKPWDYAAGLVIIEESGGVMEPIKKPANYAKFDLYSSSIICATNRQLLEECRYLITKK